MRFHGLASFLILASCSKGAPPPQEPMETPPASEPTDTGAEVADESDPHAEEAKAMHERFLRISEIRESLIAGNLSSAQQQALGLANDEALLRAYADWGLHTDKMKEELRAVGAATDLRTASVHTTAAARTCGRCHESLSVATLDEDNQGPPAEEGTVGGVMRQHHWAINRMWEGLVAPSDEAWLLGAKTLVEIADQAQQDPKAKSRKGLLKLLENLGELALEASQSVTGPERTDVLGQLLSECSGCHELMR